MHDIRDLDTLGVPGGFIASSEFVDAADVQAKSLGFDARRVFVPHPIQDRTDEEISEIADKALDDVLAMIGQK